MVLVCCSTINKYTTVCPTKRKILLTDYYYISTRMTFLSQSIPYILILMFDCHFRTLMLVQLLLNDDVTLYSNILANRLAHYDEQYPQNSHNIVKHKTVTMM